MYGNPIPWARKAKYLGVTLDHHLTFHEHLKAARSRAAFRMGLPYIVMTKSSLSLKCKLRLYTAVIRPIMTYYVCVVFSQNRYLLTENHEGFSAIIGYTSTLESLP